MSIPFPVRVITQVPEPSAGIGTKLGVGGGALVQSTVQSVSPMDFGATGNGTANDAAHILAALQSGYPVDGGERVYAVNGSVAPTSLKGIRRLNLKQLDTTSTSLLGTLNITGLDNWEITGLDLDLNGGNRTTGTFANRGLVIADCQGFKFNGNRIHNGGRGHGLYIGDTLNTGFQVMNNLVEDFYWVGTDPSDDVIIGLWCHFGQNFKFSGNTVRNCYGFDLSNNPRHRRTRGYGFGNIDSFSMLGNSVDTTEQGFDFSGSDVGKNFTFMGNTAKDCGTVGFKFAVSGRQAVIVGNVAIGCNWYGMMFSGWGTDPAIETDPRPGFFDVSTCLSVDTGQLSKLENAAVFADTLGSVHETAGFKIENDHGYDNNNSPCGIRFILCTARDTQTVKTQDYGFKNNVTPDPAFEYNEVIDCKVQGTTGAGSDFSGFNYPFVKVSAGATNVLDATWTSVDFTTEDADSCNVHSPTSNPNQILAPFTGWALIEAYGQWATNSTGLRQMRLKLNGAVVGGSAYAIVPAISGNSTSISFHLMLYLTRGNVITLEHNQNSTATISLSSQTLSIAKAVH